MSDFKVPCTKILKVEPHPGADRLEIATVYGFQVVVQKDKFKVGDRVIYIPVDSILPPWLEEELFPKDSKVTLHNSRVRQIRLRGLASQGLLVDPNKIIGRGLYNLHEDNDISDQLSIVKYEPPAPKFAQTQGKDKQRNRKHEHPQFHKYNGLDNIKWFPSLFQEGEQVVIQEKLHGTNARASRLPYIADSLYKKVLKFLGLAPETEECYGSNNVQKSVKSGKQHFYDEDVWGNAFKSIDVFSKIKLGETVFGEIVGPGIQKNYDYDLKEHRFVLFDVKILQPDGKQVWLDPPAVEQFAKERGFEHVPVLYVGPYNKELAYSLTKGNSVYAPSQKVREGIVIKAFSGYSVEGNKRALKWISEAYLDDKTNTDFH